MKFDTNNYNVTRIFIGYREPSNLQLTCLKECYETGKDITGTDIESQNQKADAAADDVLPVQIECRLNKLSTLTVHSLTPVLFPLSSCIHLFIPNIKVLTIWRELVRCGVHTSKFFSQFQFWKYKNSLNIWIQ